MNVFTILADCIRVPFGYALEWLYRLTGSYGAALIIFALVVKLILLPVSMKSKKNMMKMSRLAPKIKALEIKYAADKNKYQMEVMKLQQEEGVSATGGCLWTLLPLVILIILYQVIRNPLVYLMHIPAEQARAAVQAVVDSGVELGGNSYYHQMIIASRMEEFLPVIRQAVPELSGAVLTPINFEFLGVNLGQIPTWRFWTLSGWPQIGLFLIPLVSAASQWVSMIVSQKFNSSVTTNEKGEQVEDATAAAQSMKTMNLIMPIMSLWIGYSMPASMSIYWIAQAVFGLGQEAFLTVYYRKDYDAEDELRRQLAAEEAEREAERARVRAEKRAKMGDVTDPNTSKRKLAAKERAERGPVIEGKLTPEEREALKKNQSDCLSGIPERPYCKGRAYKADRYGRDGVERSGEDEPVEADVSEDAGTGEEE